MDVKIKCDQKGLTVFDHVSKIHKESVKKIHKITAFWTLYIKKWKCKITCFYTKCLCNGNKYKGIKTMVATLLLKVVRLR